MKKLVALLALAGALALAATAGAARTPEALVPQGGSTSDTVETTVGNNDTATVRVSAPLAATTAYVVGFWSSATIASPVSVTYTVSCQNAGNNSFATFQVLAGRNVNGGGAGIQYFTASPLIAGPWFGWDVCQTTVTISQAGDGTEDHSLVAWLASHNTP